MWIVLHTYFMWCNTEERGSNILREYQLLKQDPLFCFVNDTMGLRVVWNCFCEWTRSLADTDLVDRVTSAGIQGLVG